MILNTQDLINKLSGKNKAFISRVAKHQEERYGNVDIFSATIIYTSKYTQIITDFGENWITFMFDKQGNLIDTYGNGQGHRYQKSLESVARELFKIYGMKKLRVVVYEWDSNSEDLPLDCELELEYTENDYEDLDTLASELLCDMYHANALDYIVL